MTPEYVATIAEPMLVARCRFEACHQITHFKDIMHQIRFWLELCSTSRWRSLQHSSRPASWILRVLLLRREREGERRKGETRRRGTERKGRKKKWETEGEGRKRKKKRVGRTKTKKGIGRKGRRGHQFTNHDFGWRGEKRTAVEERGRKGEGKRGGEVKGGPQFAVLITPLFLG